MRNIYRLLLAAILCLYTFILKAQNIDTSGLQRNKNGTISFSHVLNAKIANAINFLKTTLQTTSSDSFALIKQTTDKLGMLHQRYQQYYKGIKVDRAEFSLHGKEGNIEIANGHYATVSLNSIEPDFDEKQALEKALSFVNAKRYKWEDAAMEQFAKQNSKNLNATYYPKGELIIVKDSVSNFQLAWMFCYFNNGA